MPASDSGNRRFAVLALFLAMVGAASMLYFHLYLRLYVPSVLAARAAQGLGNGYAFGDDFYPVWLTAQQWQSEHRDPYGPEMTREIQTGLFGRALDARNPGDPPTDYRQFAYPAFTDLLFWPSAGLEFPTLRIVLAVLLPALTAISLWLWLLALDWRLSWIWFAALALLTLCNYPVLEALFAEQPGLVVGFLLASAILALRRQRLLLAGVLLSLTLIKPQMTVVAVGYILLWSFAERRRARLWVSFLLTTLVLMGLSLWIWPRWMGQWTRILFGYHRYATPPLVILLPGTTLGPYLGPAIIVGLLGVAAVLAWQNRRTTVASDNFWLTFSLLLAITSVTLLPGQAIYDHIILIPGILLLLRHRRELQAGGRVPRTLLALAGIVLGWQWVAALAVIVAHPWLASSGAQSSALNLPIRTAASLPFAVLALLVSARRIRPFRDPELS